METGIYEVGVLENSLQKATTPEEAAKVELLAAAAKAYHKEKGDFENVVAACRIYILARRKTTELIAPNIIHGGDRPSENDSNFEDDHIVTLETLEDYGFTAKQWSRRKKELEVTDADIDHYIDECIETNVEPTIFGLLRYALQIIGDSTGNEWWTPAVYMESVRNVLGEIDLDPASCPEANAVVKAKRFYSESDNGLVQPWFGHVFLNPPYSVNKEFAEKMLAEFSGGSVTEAIVLLGAHAIETKWFAAYWDHTLCFTGHRIKFNTPTGPAVAGNIAGSVFIYLGQDPIKFANEFNKHGFVVRRWPQ
jgi:ParB family chromosome partitioning protein